MATSRVLIGGVLGTVVGGDAALWQIAAAGAGVIGATALAHYSMENHKQKLLLDTYRTELGAMLGKEARGTTVDDLLANAGKSKALVAALNYFRDTRNFYIACQAVTMGLVIGGLALVNSTGMPTAALAGGAALVYNEIFNTVSTIGSVFTTKNLSGTITKEVRAIADQISLGGRISSTRVFSVFVQADAELAEAIHAKYNNEYEQLSIAQKREVVAQCDGKYHIYAVTDDINAGRILPTELAFLAYGEKSGVPRKGTALRPHELGSAYCEAPAHSQEHARLFQDKVQRQAAGVRVVH